MSASPSNPRRPVASSDWRQPIKAAWVAIFVFFGVGGVWAAYSRLDQAAIAKGEIVSQSNRKTIQHLEGGIVQEVLVRDGQLVQEGSLLVRLADVSAAGNLTVLKSQLIAAVAEEARLVAERDDLPAVAFPNEVSSDASDPTTARVIADQLSQFRERRANYQGQINILTSKISQLSEQIKGFEQVNISGKEQTSKIRDELVGLHALYAKKLIPVTRIYALEREMARIQGEVGQSASEIARLKQAAGETQLQIDQMRSRFLETVSRDLPATRKVIVETRAKMHSATDVVQRIDIRAPQTGVVQGLKVFTVGGVVRPGDVLMELAPVSDVLLARIEINPLDIDGIAPGLDAEIMFPAFATRRPPLFRGKVTSVSRDRLLDEATRRPYFAGEVTIEQDAIPENYKKRIVPGMPVEVFVATGERSALQYIVGPVLQRMQRSMREQ
ncbi:putative RTX secretion protein D [Bosea sp. LC85]|nr:putative RTX secretion protein D [Bosea sp. LC85]